MKYSEQGDYYHVYCEDGKPPQLPGKLYATSITKLKLLDYVQE
jgi:hypothetical protein